jgi:uncharacterized membrane protein YdjX (TVP38/TMEM64 family)
MDKKKIIIILLGIAIVGAFLYFDLSQYLNLESLKENKGKLDEVYKNNFVATLFIFFAIYIAATALSLPGATILTLAGGAIFGRLTGLALVSFASTIGATCAFLVSRMLLGEKIQEKYADRLKIINDGVEKDGVMYLLSLRFIPVFPFFLINLLMGVTKMPTWKFYVFSQIGMIPGTFVYVNAGTALAEINQIGDIASPKVLLSFVLLGIFPLIMKAVMKLVEKLKKKEMTEDSKAINDITS